jgi:hypothetical protein
VSQTLYEYVAVAPWPLSVRRSNDRADTERRSRALVTRPVIFFDLPPQLRQPPPVEIVEIAEVVVRTHEVSRVTAPARMLQELRRRKLVASSEAERRRLHDLDEFMSGHLHELDDLYVQTRAAIHAGAGV